MFFTRIVLYEGDAPSSAEKAAVEIGTGEEIYGDLYDDAGEKDKLLRAKYIAVSLQALPSPHTLCSIGVQVSRWAAK